MEDCCFSVFLMYLRAALLRGFEWPAGVWICRDEHFDFTLFSTVEGRRFPNSALIDELASAPPRRCIPDNGNHVLNSPL